ncbi:alpha/beta fold hydrolase [Streptomyces sp. NPDC050211]|uniref:S9 family peptidase n=1 Tax=Streptomyces sp. NPDC050211 TaxID=3154932 RepID=UPI003423D70F
MTLYSGALEAESSPADRCAVPSVGLPVWGRERPGVCAVRGNASGTAQFYLWDLTTGAFRQLTDAAHGVELGLVDPRGRRLWWYRDDDGSEQGHWVRSPLRGGPAVPALPGMPGGSPEGLALGRSSLAVSAVGEPDGGYGLYVMRPGAAAVTPLRLSRSPLYVGGISDDESLVLYVHAERGDPQRTALRVVGLDGASVGELCDWPASGIEVLPFGHPFEPGGHRVLATHERRGVRAPLLWDPRTGEVREIATSLPGEVRAQFYPDGRALLLHHRHHGRSELLRHSLADGRTTALPTPPGTVHEVAARPDGGHWYTFSSAATAPVLYDGTGSELLSVPRAFRPASPVREILTDGAGGPVPAYVSTPTGQGERQRDGAPHPAVFLLHGGPHAADGDAYLPAAAAWNDAGYTVVRVNYRGSGDNGRSWRLAQRAAVGHTELADVAAVRARLVADRLVDPGRCVLAGGSWGGYLVLLGLGTQPGLWACGVAENPVGDYIAAYEEELEGLRWVDRAMFGGSPAEVPATYAASSPLTHAGAVRAPLLVLAGEHDPRCPPRQVENYVAALRGRGADVEVRYRAMGHRTAHTGLGAESITTQITFVHSRVGTRPHTEAGT